MLEKTNESHSREPILRDAGEFGTIARLTAKLPIRPGVRVGIGDDCAVLESLETPLVTCDALVEGVHFRRDWTTPFDLGRKTLAVSLSDLASSGARPVAAFLSVCAPPELEARWLDAFYDGLESLARGFSFSVAGGDTTRSPVLVLNATLVGELVPEANRKPVLRNGARVGDCVCVTGDLGASAAGLQFLLSERAPTTPAHGEVLRRHFDPTPRLETMRAMLRANRNAVHAAMDVSDGLASDARHIAARSGVRLKIDAAQLPIANATRQVARELNQDARAWAWSGGEDYELLLCAAPGAFEELRAACESTGAALTCLGEVAEGEAGVEVANAPIGAGWTHF